MSEFVPCLNAVEKLLTDVGVRLPVAQHRPNNAIMAKKGQARSCHSPAI
jgi:hypothetical protein